MMKKQGSVQCRIFLPEWNKSGKYTNQMPNTKQYFKNTRGNISNFFWGFVCIKKVEYFWNNSTHASFLSMDSGWLSMYWCLYHDNISYFMQSWTGLPRAIRQLFTLWLNFFLLLWLKLNFWKPIDMLYHWPMVFYSLALTQKSCIWDLKVGLINSFL